MAKASTLIDAFDGGTLNALLWDAGGVGGHPIPTVGGGNLRHEQSTTSSGFDFISSKTTYDLTDDAIYVEVAVMPTGRDFQFQFSNLVADSGPWWECYEGTLYAVARVSGSSALNTPVSLYNLATHRFLRIRVASSLVYWEFSADGATWTDSGRTPQAVADFTGLTFTAGTIKLYGGNNAAVAADAPKVEIAGLNVGAGAAEPDPEPTIGLSASTFTFVAAEGGSLPATKTLTITNTGDGTLDGLTLGAISYDTGASGWLTRGALSSTTAPATTTLDVNTTALTAGVLNSASFTVDDDGDATNGPRTVTVNFTPYAPGTGTGVFGVDRRRRAIAAVLAHSLSR